jgi:hypothetical protein
MKIWNHGALASMLVFTAMLSACGDSGGVNSAPTPTPTPSPTPTPAPAPTYQKVSELSGNRHYETAGISFQGNGTSLTGHATQGYGNSVKVDYTAATDTYTLTAPNGTTQSFSPGNVDVTKSNSNLTYYDKTAGGFHDVFQLVLPPVKGVNLSYTVIGTWSHANISAGTFQGQFAVGGIPTIASDMPKTGSASYNVDGTGAYITNGLLYGGDLSDSTFSANFGTGTLNTTLHMRGALQTGGAVVDFGTANGTGSISSSWRPAKTGILGARRPGFDEADAGGR